MEPLWAVIRHEYESGDADWRDDDEDEDCCGESIPARMPLSWYGYTGDTRLLVTVVGCQPDYSVGAPREGAAARENPLSSFYSSVKAQLVYEMSA